MLSVVLLAYATATFQPVTAATTSQPAQVFVRDTSSQAQPGENGHVWGLRAPSDADADSAPLMNARGEPIRTVLGVWRTSDGSASIDPTPQGTKVHAVFHHLLPSARYSVFLRQLAGRTGAVLTPLDLVGTQNNFSADAQGNAELALTSPLEMPSGTQILLIYHSDGVDHQSSVGNPSVNAHAQLITRVP